MRNVIVSVVAILVVAAVLAGAMVLYQRAAATPTPPANPWMERFRQEMEKRGIEHVYLGHELNDDPYCLIAIERSGGNIECVVQ